MAEWKTPQQELPERFEECAYSYDITFMTKMEIYVTVSIKKSVGTMLMKISHIQQNKA